MQSSQNDQVLLDLMRSIEGLFKPNKIINPGKIVQEI
jgi:hypothetical protein